MAINKEVESKIIEVNFEEMSKKIVKIGWVLEFYKQKFTAVWVENELGYKYRIRKEWARVMEETKKIISSTGWVKEADETPKEVYDFKEALDFAKAIGFKEISFSVKERTQYLLDLTTDGKWEVKIVLDDYSDLDGLQIPTLLEIEAINREVIVEVAHLLWFLEADLKDWWARSLVEYYQKK